MNLKEVQDNIRKLQCQLSGGDYDTLKKQICEALIQEIVAAHKNGELNIHEYPVLHALIEASLMVDIIQGVIDLDYYKQYTANQEYGSAISVSTDADKGLPCKSEQSSKATTYIEV